jgi:hypothetical protein
VKENFATLCKYFSSLLPDVSCSYVWMKKIQWRKLVLVANQFITEESWIKVSMNIKAGLQLSMSLLNTTWAINYKGAWFTNNAHNSGSFVSLLSKNRGGLSKLYHQYTSGSTLRPKADEFHILGYSGYCFLCLTALYTGVNVFVWPEILCLSILKTHFWWIFRFSSDYLMRFRDHRSQYQN